MMNSAVVTLFMFPTPRWIPLVFRPPLTMVTQHCVTKNSLFGLYTVLRKKKKVCNAEWSVLGFTAGNRRCSNEGADVRINPLNAELNPICHLLALLGAHHILHISG